MYSHRLIGFLVFCVVCAGWHVQAFADSSFKGTIPVLSPWQNSGIENQTNDRDLYRKTARPVYKKPTPQKPTLSTIEQAYSDRVVSDLTQFGYDMFHDESTPAPVTNMTDTDTAPAITPPMGAVQDDFILSIGDETTVTVSGQRNTTETVRINPQGMIVLDDFPPVMAAGQRIQDVRDTLNTHAQSRPNTRVHLNLATVQQIGVLVVGHVSKPGRKTLTVFHTVLDALMEAEGIRKTGSLRRVKIVRDGRSRFIDLYALLLHGHTATDMTLKNGDKIIVPSIGDTVAVTGAVKTPAIYELISRHPMGEGRAMSPSDALDMAGGMITPGQNRIVHMRPTSTGADDVSDVTDMYQTAIKNGSIVSVLRGQDRQTGAIELVGHTRKPGIYATDEYETLSTLFASQNMLGDDIYPLIGVIERRDDHHLARTYVSFPLNEVLQDTYDADLQEGDVIHVFSNKQIADLADETLEPVTDEGSIDDDADLVLNTTPIGEYLNERAVFLRGAVRQEGAYPIADNTSLDALLATAGGLSLEASKNNIELTMHESGKTVRDMVDITMDNPAMIGLQAGDTVRVNQKFKKVNEESILIIGEVNHPGHYDLAPGDRLSDLLERAGGLTAQAYPDGTIFSRKSERKAEEMRYRMQARSLKQSIAAALETRDEDQKLNVDQIAEVRRLAKELETVEGAGRITVTAIPELLTTKPALDILLEKGDRIYIPKRTNTIRVRGEVLSPAALQFTEDKDPIDYIYEAGGFTFHADKDRAFVLYPDGSAEPLKVSYWNHSPIFIPPGSTIIVPRDPKPFDFVENVRDVSQIIANLAVTTIFIDDISGD